jgi:hypothetical protein
MLESSGTLLGKVYGTFFSLLLGADSGWPSEVEGTTAGWGSGLRYWIGKLYGRQLFKVGVHACRALRAGKSARDVRLQILGDIDGFPSPVQEKQVAVFLDLSPMFQQKVPAKVGGPLPFTLFTFGGSDGMLGDQKVAVGAIAKEFKADQAAGK